MPEDLSEGAKCVASGSWWRVDVQCPFYRTDDARRKTITCEGVIPGTSVVNSFVSRDDYDGQHEKFCCAGYETCELYLALMQGYVD